MIDSIQSLVDLQGNQLLASPRTTAADAGRTQFIGRNTRMGVAFQSPEAGGIKASGVIESDFLGYNPQPGTAAGAKRGLVLQRRLPPPARLGAPRTRTR